ncbi:hypothetical protein [Actinomadura miaoliensis]|uniref:Tyr recombinase domain-containing protein n=1 Tax=Actinomadura miaoliensis TaxID=430685 RepID=A0ABP7VLR0_9ACTN
MEAVAQAIEIGLTSCANGGTQNLHYLSRWPALARIRSHGEGWTLHQLRHSTLQHLAAAGRTAAELQAKSRHAHLAGLGAYVHLGEHTSARITADADSAARRRTR